jgi:hypothetical protein
MSSTLNDIQDFFELDRGKFNLRFEYFNFKELIDSIIKMYKA